MKHGDFTKLAENYVKYRPAYSPFVLDSFLGLFPGEREAITGADIGAGTGIWTKMLANRGITMHAVEPNDAMRTEGMQDVQNVTWHAGSAENTGLADSSVDFVCMASSFHWADYDVAMKEFQRVLKPGGFFVALWNPRRIETNPLLVDIENKLYSLKPEMQRKSSGNSDFCNNLLNKLHTTPCVSDVIYVEGIHTEFQNRQTYIGLWESVNDIQVQLGQEKFAEFLDYIRSTFTEDTTIEAQYTTRAWIAKIKH